MSYKPKVLDILAGGTNASSFGTSNAIVTYNGTSLVNYSGPQISASGINTNTTQPSFLASVTSNVNNVTGAGTYYTILFNTESFDIGGNFNPATGIFTAPVSGKYFFSASAYLTGCTIANNVQIVLKSTGASIINSFYRTASALDITLQINSVLNMTAGNTVYVQIYVGGEAADTVDLQGNALPNFKTYFSGFLHS